MATGTGIAPIKAILDKLSKSDEMTRGINLSLYWGNREIKDFFWKPNYSVLNLQYIPVLSKTENTWAGRAGYIQDNVISDNLDLSDTQVYACGSPSMIKSAKALFIEKGLEEKHFYSDAFVSS